MNLSDVTLMSPRLTRPAAAQQHVGAGFVCQPTVMISTVFHLNWALVYLMFGIFFECVYSRAFLSNVAVSLDNHHNAQYTGSLFVGTPAQRVEFMFDTGSSLTWISPQFFNSAQSSTFQKLSRPKTESHFGDGASFSGSTVSDFVRFSPATDVSFRLEFSLIEVIRGSHSIRNFGGLVCFRGVFGHWPCSLNLFFIFFWQIGLAGLTDKGRSFIEVLVQTIGMKSICFSFFLSLHPSPLSAFTIGTPNSAYFHQPLVYVPTSHSTKWTVALESVYLLLRHSNAPVTINISFSSMDAMIDTGTSLIIAPSNFLDYFRATFSLHSDCSNINNLPTLQLRFKTAVLALEPDVYVIRTLTRSDRVIRCSLALRPHSVPANNNMWILGNVFQRRFFTAFDQTRQRIGFAQAKRIVK
jgi:hypothetical protein